MNLLTLLGIAFGLAMDAFAVAIAVGSRHKQLHFRPVFRLSFHFGLFQFLMPIIGWLVGSGLEKYLKNYDHWVAFALLAFVGGKMVKESFETEADETKRTDLTRKMHLIVLSVATSIDALAVGLTFALLDYRIWSSSAVIGVVACGMTILGMFLGKRLGDRFGKRMELVGGLVLLAIGFNILLQHISN
jgi:manganese efflux pump family protein